MNSEPNRKIRDKLYTRLVQETIKIISVFLGVPLTTETRSLLAKKSYNLIRRSRDLARDIAYRDYSALVSDPVPKVSMNRFTEELWRSSIDNATKDVSYVTVSVTEDIGMKADYWARDAEWGERVQLAEKDNRIGRIARVDFEPPTCPFCTVLNSRGPVYISEEAVLRTAHTGDTCDAVFVPVGETVYPGVEHTAESLRRYKAAVEAVGPHQGVGVIMKELEKQYPDRPPGRVKTTANTAALSAGKARADKLRSDISRLEKSKPTTPAAQKHREEQISRNKQILSVLETNNG